PGALLARALRVRLFSAVLAWSLGAIFVAMAIVFLVHASLTLALILLALIATGTLAWTAVGPSNTVLQARSSARQAASGASNTVLQGVLVAAAGVGLGIALWAITTHLTGGDDLFHLARVRKLDDFGALSLHAVDEFKDGGLHPGYAFPLWHGWLALVAKVADVDPAKVVQHESSLLVPLALVLAYELGFAVFRSRPLALGVTAAQAAMTALAARDGGSYVSLALPATAARQLLVIAVLALFFEFVRAPSRRLG